MEEIEITVNYELILKKQCHKELWNIMNRVCFKFVRKNYDDDLFQTMLIAYEKLPEDIKNLNHDDHLSGGRKSYIYKTLIRACSRYLMSKSNIVKKQTPLTCRETEEFIKLRRSPNLTETEKERLLYLENLKNSVHLLSIMENDEEGENEVEYKLTTEIDDTKQILKLAMSNLTSDEKLLIDKHYIYGYTDDEISKDFRITRSAVQVRRKKILLKMIIIQNHLIYQL
jgi:RNA polymerase sigma factor (sigma-70 family)